MIVLMNALPTVAQMLCVGRRMLFAGCLLAVAAVQAAPERRPAARGKVLLIPGMADTGRAMKPLAWWLARRGWQVETVRLKPCDGSAPLEELGGQVAKYVEEHYAKGEKLNLVGFSMGGLVGRYYAERLGGHRRIQSFVTVSTPHRGTWMAHFLNLPGTVQMRPGSKFLADLDEGAGMMKGIRTTAIWTPMDFIVVPARNSRAPFGKDVVLWAPFHGLIILTPPTWCEVDRAMTAS